MVDRVLLGHIGGGNYGLKISLPGVDVKTANENDRDALSFNSNWNESSIPVHSVNRVQMGRKLYHDLGYYPVCDASIRVGSTVYGHGIEYYGFLGIGSWYYTSFLVIRTDYIMPSLWLEPAQTVPVSTTPSWNDSFFDIIIFARQMT